MLGDDRLINPASTIPEAVSRQLRFGQCAPAKLTPLLGDIIVDALVFEFMGLAMLALMVIVLAVPSGRQTSRRIRPH
jgi:glycerol uptake facilitator-like aquaporin